MKRILLIDGSSMIFRAFYAIRDLTTKDGIPTNGVYGFLSMYYKMIDEYDPDYILVAFDRSGPTFREKDYKDYKANRQQTPSELSAQFGILKDVLDSMGVSHIDMDEYEADDIIGTLSTEFNKLGIESVIVTGDRDYLQLVDGDTKVVLTKRGITQTEVYTPDIIKEEFGLEPKQLIDVKGFMGDQSDNIPGVPGVGEKTALKLIKEYGSMESVYENLDNISGKVLKKNLEDYHEIALMSKKLGEIYVNVPLDLEIDNYKFKDPDYPALKEKFERLEFRTFASRVPIDDDTEEFITEYVVLNDDSIKDLVEEVKKSKSFTFKLFYDEESYIKSNVSAIGIKAAGNPAIYVSRIANEDNDSAKGVQLNLTEEIVEEDDVSSINYTDLIDGRLSEIFTENSYTKLSFDIKSDIFFFLKHGISLENYRDVMISDYLVDPSQTSYTIEKQALKYLNKSIISYEELTGKGKNKKKLSELPDDKLFQFISEYVTITERVYPVLDEIIEEREMHELYYEIELPLIKVLADMERTGFKVDIDELRNMGKELEKKISALELKIYELAGMEFNIASPKQLGEVLFDKLGLPVIKKTKTGYSTDAEVLDKLYDKHEIIESILEYRSVSKLMSTYIDGLIPLIGSDGRIHSTFRQNITATGRISSTEPNLQNIPIKTEEGRKIRKAFVASKGYKLVDADYSQIELRVLAHLSGDKVMIDAFKNDEDIHTKTASEVFHVGMDEVTPPMRSRAKAVNFGIVYGISDYGLSRDLDIPRSESKEYIDKYLATYPDIKKYMADIIVSGKELGYVETILNRRRYIPELKSKNFNIRGFGERIALNTPIQGSAADIIKIAMVRVYDALKKDGLKSRLILQVHDELIIEAAEDELDTIKQMVVKIMEDAHKLSVDLKTDINIGDSWYDSK